ncbi:MAG: hypothetical protein J6Y74_03470 [Clostridia bacterium]|nr:hypothetical protein [Clostridia bacterium]
MRAEGDKSLLADSTALIIDKDWEYWGDAKREWISLDDVQVTVAGEKPESVEKIIKHPPYPQKFKPFSIRKSYVKEMLRYGCTPTIFFNGEIYCAASLSKNKNLPSLTVYESGYFDFFNTCKVQEFRYEAGKKRDFKIRKKGEKKTGILDLENRACSIGVVTLTVIRLEDAKKNEDGKIDEKNNGLYFLMHKRGGNVAEGPGTVHVVPAGSFQPFVGFEKDSKPMLSSTVYREFCEEVLSTTDMRELSSASFLGENDAYKFIANKETVSGDNNPSDKSDHNPPAKPIEISRLYYLGAGLDPYNTKMEIMSLLFIDLREEKSFNKFIKYATANAKNSDIPEGEVKEKAFASKENRLREALKKASDTEGSIVLERFNTATLEEYFGNINIVPAAKELMYIAYKRFDEIEGFAVEQASEAAQ